MPHGGVPAGTGQSSGRHAMEKISAQGPEREDPFPPPKILASSL